MNASRTFVTSAVALSVLAVFGCASDRPVETAAAPVVYIAPVPVAVVAPRPADPVYVQAEPTPYVATPYVATRNEPLQPMASSEMITERAPRADRN